MVLQRSAGCCCSLIRTVQEVLIRLGSVLALALCTRLYLPAHTTIGRISRSALLQRLKHLESRVLHEYPLAGPSTHRFTQDVTTCLEILRGFTLNLTTKRNSEFFGLTDAGAM